MTVHELIERLEAARIHFTLTSVRENAVMFQVTIPGERWEVEVMPDGAVDVERFRSNGTIYHERALDELFTSFSDN